MKKKQRKQTLYKGWPLVDASEDLEIEVTKSDVLSSKKGDPHNCAAAVATKRQLKAEVEVHISRTYVKDNKHKRYIRFLTPESIRREITSFDRSAIFEPGEYVLKAASPGQKLGVYRGRSTQKNSNYKRRGAVHHTVNIRETARAKR
jgi:hypothetical protein